MNKPDIIKALKDANIEHDSNQTVAELKKLLPEQKGSPEPAKPKKVTVVCAVASLFEAGENYTKDEEFEVTPSRAKALGKSVKLKV